MNQGYAVYGTSTFVLPPQQVTVKELLERMEAPADSTVLVDGSNLGTDGTIKPTDRVDVLRKSVPFG